MNPRRIIRWEKVRGPKAVTALIIGTALGAGLAPVAPGTMGTIMGMPIAYFSCDWAWPLRVALWLALTVAGTWAAKVFDETMGTADNQNIVIDEVVGLGITAWTAGTHISTLVASFVLFRAFDIIKPWPVRTVDKWSKGRSAWVGGFGVMADDILAGFQGLAVVLLLQWRGLLP